ncbi:MAG: translation initiation factor IF-6 [Thermoproteota archaeon]|nr:MAG: translation initiation factor IF-6 [Candidatus Korarchaeota archaeon]RLG55559.1 MAG: translation initiation factor IF-6 [Candidatus Korarchaeota archaeon]
MSISVLEVEKSPYIGLHIVATDSFALISHKVKEKHLKTIKDTLKVDVYRASVCSSDLIGLFLAANSEHIVIPSACTHTIPDSLVKEHGVTIHEVGTALTALGNNILLNDQAALINPEFTRLEEKAISGLLGLPAVRMRLAGYATVGAVALATNKGCVLCKDCSQEELDAVSKAMKVPAGLATVNSGSPYVRLGVVANSHGVIVGSETTSIELEEILSALNF